MVRHKKTLCAVGALLLMAVAGCAWESGDEPVYYNEIEAQQKQHLAQGGSGKPDPGVGQGGNADQQSPDLAAGANPPPPPPGNPEPSPWKTAGGNLQGAGNPQGQTTTTSRILR